MDFSFFDICFESLHHMIPVQFQQQNLGQGEVVIDGPWLGVHGRMDAAPCTVNYQCALQPEPCLAASEYVCVCHPLWAELIYLPIFFCLCHHPSASPPISGPSHHFDLRKGPPENKARLLLSQWAANQADKALA